jgi:hypothetical protein
VETWTADEKMLTSVQCRAERQNIRALRILVRAPNGCTETNMLARGFGPRYQRRWRPGRRAEQD